MNKSNKCIHDEHGVYEGIIREIIGMQNNKMCTCSCFNNMYQLIRKTLALVNQRNIDLVYGFPGF